MHLENYFILGKPKIKEFRRIKDRVQARVEGWQSQLLSRAGKATLIKEVAQAIQVYSVSIFKLPQGICKDLDALVRKFWWESNQNSNRYLAFKSWGVLCSPKEYRALGFRRFKDLNQALLE